MKFLLLLAMACALPSCGKKNKTKPQCRDKEHMTIQCQTINTPAYGGYYARELCQRKYTVERCY